MSLLDLRTKREKLQAITWVGLPIVMIGGWFYPKMGFLLLGCMAGAVGIAFYKGRAWCDWMCPRGSFFDLLLGKLSLKNKMPSFFRKTGTKLGMLAIMMGALGAQIYFSEGNLDRIGLAFVSLLTVTTIAGIILGIVYHPRNWCHICPMGTIGSFVSTDKYAISIKDTCNSCGACAKICPMQLSPHIYKNGGVMKDKTCIKCSVCVAGCPKKALDLPKAA